MNQDALKKAIDCFSIAMIYVRATNANLHPDFDPLIPNQELIAQFNIATHSYRIKELLDVNTSNQQRILVYQTEARMRYLKTPLPEPLESDEQLNNLTVAEIVALFSSEYVINSDKELSQDSITEFGRINVPHQVWPYWREYCQSTCARMSLPVSIMPMYVINKITENDA